MSQTSIGERLRQAREAIPASLAEASRATRVRVDFLEAMERDSFTFISGRVYVVGMLRSYARWLRLDEAEIAREYDRIYGAAEAPALAESLATRNERSMRVQRPRKPQWAMAAAAAIAIIVVLLLFSLLGGGGNVAAPPPVPSSPTPSRTITPTPTPTVVGGFNGVQLVVSVTGTSSWMRVVAGNTTPQLVAFQGTMQQGVTRTFSAVDLLRLQIANLGAVRVSLNGRDLGPLGQAGQTGSYIVTKGDASLTPDPSTTVPPPGQRSGPVVYPFRTQAPRPPPPAASPSPSPTPTPAVSTPPPVTPTAPGVTTPTRTVTP